MNVLELSNEAMIDLGLKHSLHTSERKSFRSCRLRWNWAYREYYYPKVTPQPLEFGVAYHAAMEKWYDPTIWAHPDHREIGSALAIAAFNDASRKQLEKYKKLNGRPTPEVMGQYQERLDLGKKMVEYYTKKISPLLDKEFSPLGVEVPFEIELGFKCKCDKCRERYFDYVKKNNSNELSTYWEESEGLPVTYGGRIDMVAVDDYGRIWITDWKRLTLDTRIPTPSGWKTMKELEVGDYVFDSNGKAVEVLGEKTWEPDTVYEVVFVDGTIVECSSDHLWQVYNAHTSLYEVVTTIQIMYKPNYINYSIEPIAGPVEFFETPQNKLPIHPYILGSLIGDGCFTQSVLTYSSQSGETVELLKKYADIDATFKDDRQSGNNRWTIHGPWRDKLKKLGLWGKYSGEKYIPDIYKYASIADRILLLQGLCDTDGNTGLLRWTTTSLQLAKDFRHLIWSLGGTANMSVSKERLHQNGHTINVSQYNVNYTFSTNIEPNQLERKRVGRVVRKRKTRRMIKEVRKTNRQEPMKCIYVDSPEHLFATENFVLTHNTTSRILEEGKQAAFLELDDQISSYCVALWKLGRPVAGFIYHEQRKAVPEPPQELLRMNKGRMFSVSQNANTDYQTFKAHVFEHDRDALEAGCYADYLTWLRNEGPRFFQRHQIHRTEAQMQNLFDDMVAEAKDILGNPRIYPQPGRFSCTTCLYRQPCIGRSMNEDYYYTLNSMFDRREKHYYEESEDGDNKRLNDK